MVYYNAYITGEYNALYTPTNHGFFHCSTDSEPLDLKEVMSIKAAQPVSFKSRNE